MFRDFSEEGGISPILHANGRKLDASFAKGCRPPPRMTVSEWAARYRRFPGDDAFPGPWRHSVAPELVEIMDALSPHDPCEEVALMKCAQSGGSASAENWIGSISDNAPGPMLFVQATLKAAWDWAAEKFWPMVDATPRLNPARGGTIRGMGQADGEGSTKHKIRFARSNGYVLLAGANSAAGLRQRTVRYAVEDDLDQFPDDLDGQGSPESMVDQRLKVYRRQGLSKRLKISTPTIKGASKIEAAIKASDQRRFYLKCPGCEKRFVPEWEHIEWPDGQPEKAHLVTPCCPGLVIEHWQKAGMKHSDGWLSIEIDGEAVPSILDEAEFQVWRQKMPQSLKRGFLQEGLISSFQTWADMAMSFVAAQGDLNKLKAWVNLMLGRTFELKGETPDYEKLMQLREQDWGQFQIPFGAIVTTMGVDVQGDGLYWELLGWGPHSENWSIAVGFIPGATDVKMEGAWVDLDALSQRGVTFPGGRTFKIDQECVDGGYHTEAAQAYCARRPNRLCVFGRAGWTLPVLGRGEAIRFGQQGKNAGKASKRSEDKAYIVGTFGVKTTLYGFLRQTIKYWAAATAEGVESKPRGLCHFNRDAPNQWFEQLTAETIITKTVNGYPRREWQPMPGRENHWLDCRVYNHAAAEKLLLESLNDRDWAALQADRYAPRDDVQGDLLASNLAKGEIAQPVAVTETGKGWAETQDWKL
jgi:phage terminase large subunit GpA-like protein